MDTQAIVERAKEYREFARIAKLEGKQSKFDYLSGVAFGLSVAARMLRNRRRNKEAEHE